MGYWEIRPKFPFHLYKEYHDRIYPGAMMHQQMERLNEIREWLFERGQKYNKAYNKISLFTRVSFNDFDERMEDPKPPELDWIT